jgi:hypothetical protein
LNVGSGEWASGRLWPNQDIISLKRKSRNGNDLALDICLFRAHLADGDDLAVVHLPAKLLVDFSAWLNCLETTSRDFH